MAGTIRVVLAESEISRSRLVAERLGALGYDVVARVKSGRDAVAAVTASDADVVIFDVHLTDGLGVLSAVAATRARAGTAALVLTMHPAAGDRSMRPQWGAVELVSAGALDEELDEDIRSMVERARAIAAEGDGFATEAASSEPHDAPSADAMDVADDEEMAFAPVFDTVLDDVDEPAALDPQETVERAIAQIVERTRMTPTEALKLMEQEADEDGRELVDVAAAVLADAA